MVIEVDVEQLQADLETSQAEAASLQEEMASLKGQLGERDAKMGEIQGQLEQAQGGLAEKDAALATVTGELGETTAKLNNATEQLAGGLDAYKALVLQANPDIPAELIKGDTIEELTVSLEGAKGIVGKVKASVEEQLKAGGVPAGAPARTGPDVSGMSSTDKIKYGMVNPPK